MEPFKRCSTFCVIVLLVLIKSAITIRIPNFPPITYDANQIPDNNLESLIAIPDLRYHEAVDRGTFSSAQDVNLEDTLLSRGIVAEEDGDSQAQIIETSPNVNSRKLDEVARKIVKSNMYFVHKYCLPKNIDPETCAKYLMTKQLPSEIYRKCEENIDRDKFAYHRLLPARYRDGIYQMVDEPAVPRAREVADGRDNSLEAEKSYPTHNLLVMQWAQFIEHDLSKPVVTTMRNGDPIKCCTSDHQMLSPRYMHPACAPLLGKDPGNVYSHVSCQNYVRNAQTMNSNCTFGPAVLLNEENGMLDLSQLYGILPEVQHQMRTFRDGLLKSSGSTKVEESLLPLAVDPSDYCVGTNPTHCFMAGDNRVNRNPFSTHLYTIFLRSHNLIAKDLKAKRPNYSDARLFEMTRKRNIEKYVGIIYRWWLPAVLGEDMVTKILAKRSVEHRGVSSEFGVAAIRFYPSMMPEHVTLNDKCPIQSLNVSKYIYNPKFLRSSCEMDSLLEGMLNSNPHKADLYYKSIVLHHCLKSNENGRGINCLALDIQRGRDHGLASYSKYLERCSGSQIHDWNSLRGFVDAKELDTLKSLYNDVHEVDLLIGAMAERQTDGLLGTTFSCLIADQFSKIWNQLDNEDGFAGIGLSPVQLLCETTSVSAVPSNVFQIASNRNRLVSCSDIL